MGYYIRVLSKRRVSMPFGELQRQLTRLAPNADLVVEGGDNARWTQVLVRKRGEDICELSCDVDSGADSLVRAEVSEFAEEIQDAKPVSAARWIERYLADVRSIYALRVLFGEGEPDWELIGAVKDAVHSWATGIVQADGEGFSNERGYHILWQFAPDVTGEWHMAVLNADGQWITYAMDLGNAEHREAFFLGEVPKGVKATREA